MREMKRNVFFRVIWLGASFIAVLDIQKTKWMLLLQLD